jgi:transcriptional regulator of acetoin/glycerol metabolism
MAALMAYRWPGNIRELRNVIERAVALCPGHLINLDDLPDQFHDMAPARVPASAGSAPLSQSKDEAERARIAEALKRTGNNRLRAAAELGISRMTLYNKLRKHGMMFGA